MRKGGKKIEVTTHEAKLFLIQIVDIRLLQLTKDYYFNPDFLPFKLLPTVILSDLSDPTLRALSLSGLASLQSLNDTVVSRVGAEVVEPEKSGALTGEDEGDPAEGIIEVPDGDTDAPVDLDASSDGLFSLTLVSNASPEYCLLVVVVLE